MLLAIWATEKNFCGQSKCSLGKSTKEIDKSLKEGRITLEPRKGKKRYQNPGFVNAPDIIKEYLGVQYLTAEQNNTFNSKERLVWINGPAGAGKSVVLCGKIIELAQQGEFENIVLLRFIGEGNNSEIYQRAFDKAGVNYGVLGVDSDLEGERCRDPADQVSILPETGCWIQVYNVPNYIGGTVELLYDLIDLLIQDRCCLFIDDLHGISYATDPPDWEEFLDRLLELAVSGNVWVACDLAQAYFMVNSHFFDLIGVVTKILSASQQIILSSNLRNTFDVAAMLQIIRERFFKSFSDYRSDVLKMIIPPQIPGHFIHGPKPVIHILNKFNDEVVVPVLEETLERLLDGNNSLDRSDIGVVCGSPYLGSEEPTDIDEIVNKSCLNPDNAPRATISVCQFENSCSAEWPAVIVVHEMGLLSDGDITKLYLALSCARVFCTAIVYPDEDLEYNHQLTRELLDELRCYAHVGQHCHLGGQL